MKTSNFQNGLQKYLMPIANKVEQQKHLQSIKDGMVAILPMIIIGSFCLLPVAFVNLFPNGTFSQWLSENLSFFTYPEKFTSGLLSIYSAFFIADSLAKRYNINSFLIGINSVIVHLTLTSNFMDTTLTTKYLGAEGLFTSIISSILVVEITRFLFNKNLYFKLPSSVPPMVMESFKSLVPLTITICSSSVISKLLFETTEKMFPQFVMDFLAPAISSMDTLFAILIIVFLTQLLWFFGLHGAAITSAIWIPFAVSYGATNISNYLAGEPVTHFFTFGFYYSMLQVTGSGITLGLVILMLRSKSKGLKAMGKASIIPSLFGINEPVIFGCPIILNPFLFFPFVFGPLAVTIFVYFSMASGFVGMPIANPPGFLPPGVGAFLMTLDPKAVLVVFLSLIFMTLIYFPFFKAMEQNELKKELAESLNANIGG